MSNETLELFEMIISEDLKRLDELAYSSSDIEQRDRLIKEIERLSTKLTEAEGLVSKAYNDDRAREIEMDKHKNLIELDKKKARTETIKGRSWCGRSCGSGGGQSDHVGGLGE